MDQYRMIDGKDFANFVSGFGSFVKGLLRYLVISIREYFLAAFITFVLIFAVGWFYSRHSKAYYESVMVCTFREMNKKVYGEMVHKLDLLVQDHSYSALSKKLSIPVQYAGCIISIEGKNRAGSMLFEDITEDKLPIYLDVKATNAALFSELDTALINYLNTGSPYLKEKLTTESLEVNTKLQVLNENIRIADSAITTILYLLKTSKPFSDSSITSDKFASLIKYKVSLENEAIVLQKRKNEVGRSVEILHGFSPSDRPLSNKDKILRFSVVASVLSSCSIAMLRKALHDKKNTLST